MKTIIIAAAFASFAATAALAQETTAIATETVAETVVSSETTTETAIDPLQQVAAQVCALISEARIIATDDLTAACVTSTLPDPIRDGSRFANRGIGSELNVLIRNVSMF